MQFKRSERVGQLIHQEIANILATKIKDPRIGFVTVTHLDISDDLRNAKVYVTIMEKDQKRSETIKGLERSASFIRKSLGHNLFLKRVPELKFLIDNTIENSCKIEKILSEIKEKNELLEIQ